jgi:hypothetical protein
VTELEKDVGLDGGILFSLQFPSPATLIKEVLKKTPSSRT